MSDERPSMVPKPKEPLNIQTNEPPELDPESAKAFALLMKNPFFKDMFMTRASGKDKKPKSYSAGSTAPYYNETFGNLLKPILDQILEDNKSKLIEFGNFGAKQPATCRNQVNQSWQWLMDHDEEADKYIILKKTFEVRIGKKGIELINLMGGTKSLVAKDIEDDTNVWRAELEDYIENGSVGKKFEKTELSLSSKQVKDLRRELQGIGCIAKVTTNRILVTKLTADQMEAMGIKMPRMEVEPPAGNPEDMN